MLLAITHDYEAARVTLAEFHRLKPEIRGFDDLRAAVPAFDLPHARRLAVRFAEGTRLLGMPD